MNNTFNMQRFLWLFNKHTKENYKSYLMSIGVLAGVMAITLCYCLYMGGLNNKIQEVIFVFSLFFSGCFFTSLIFSDLGKKKKAMTLLTLPVSNLERFLVSWIYSFVIFQVVFVACFYVVDTTIIKIFNSFGKSPATVIDITAKENPIIGMIMYFWFLHAVTFLGSVFFNKMQFVKTLLVLFGFFIIVVLLNQGFVHLIIGEGVTTSIPFSAIRIPSKENVFHYLEDQTSLPLLMTVMFSVSILSLWTAAYFRLKEKQI